jgi:pyridoxal phosphate enzyme (YggS family)
MNSADRVREAIAAGIRVCGENRVQELLQKLAENAYDGAEVHFIGHLQTNKVRQVVGNAALIQSVDSLRLLQAIQLEASRQDICQKILLQVNVAEEASKSGFTTGELPEILDKIGDFRNICVSGFMTIPPICQNPGENNKFFQEIHRLAVDITAKKYDNVFGDILSMGMSDDFEDAIACGSTMIRVGTAIFGARNYGTVHQAR